MKQITFAVHRAEEGGFWAEADDLPIVTQGEDLDELDLMIHDAVKGYFFDAPAEMPEVILWRFEKTEVAA